MARSKTSEEGGQLRVDGASSNMSRLDQIEATFSGATTHFEDANKIILQFFGESSRRVKGAHSNIESNRRGIHALKQQAEGSITQIAASRARGEVHEDGVSQLERRYQDLVETQQIQA